MKNELKLDGLKEEKKDDEEQKKKNNAANIIELNKSLDELLKNMQSQHGLDSNDDNKPDPLKDITISIVANKLHEAMMEFKMNFEGEYIFDNYEDVKKSQEYNSLFGVGKLMDYYYCYPIIIAKHNAFGYET